MMDDERATELVRWGRMARPRMKNEKELRDAIAHVRADVRLWGAACWTEEKT